ncbi:MAG: ABC transporter substrate-binding protein [Candidatus Hecatellaceae archaeon]
MAERYGRKKLLLTVVLVVIVVAAVFSGLSLVRMGPEKIRVGYLPAATYTLLWVAYEKGYFEEEGLHAALKAYSNVGEIATALSKGELDGAPLTAVAAAAFAERGKFLIVGGNSTCGTALACRAEDAGKYRKLEDLEGVKMATVLYVPGDVVVRYKLMEKKINVELKVLFTPSDALTALKKKSVDVALLWEPFASEAEEEGYKIFLWDKEVYDIIYPCCLQVFREDFARNHRDIVVKYLKAMIKAQEFCEQSPHEAAEIAAQYIPEEFGVSKEVIYRSTFYMDPKLGRARNPLDMKLHMEDLQEFTRMMRNIGILSPRMAAEFFGRVDASFIKAAMEQVS